MEYDTSAYSNIIFRKFFKNSRVTVLQSANTWYHERIQNLFHEIGFIRIIFAGSSGYSNCPIENLIHPDILHQTSTM